MMHMSGDAAAPVGGGAAATRICISLDFLFFIRQEVRQTHHHNLMMAYALGTALVCLGAVGSVSLWQSQRAAAAAARVSFDLLKTLQVTPMLPLLPGQIKFDSSNDATPVPLASLFGESGALVMVVRRPG